MRIANPVLQGFSWLSGPIGGGKRPRRAVYGPCPPKAVVGPAFTPGSAGRAPTSQTSDPPAARGGGRVGGATAMNCGSALDNPC